MSKFIPALFIATLILSLESCFDPPVYPEVPEISFKGIRFVETEGQDSLIISFDFQDGDGDIGLDNEDVYPPFHSYNVVVDSNARFVLNESLGEQIIVDSSIRFVEYGDVGNSSPYYLISTFGTLVDVYSEDDFLLPSYSCKDYIFVSDLDGDTIGTDKSDTILIEPNIFINNIVVKFLRKRNGMLEDVTEAFSPDGCTPPFNSRIPIFDEDNLGRPLKGTIHYPMISSGFISQFLNDSILVEFYIYDRALNQSNIVTSPAFTLPGLLGIN
jgi:hypothetical protein